VAAEKGDVAKAKALLDSGEEHAEPPATTCSTQSPFKRASGMGHMKHKTLTVDLNSQVHPCDLIVAPTAIETPHTTMHTRGS
jgi:hypothetical protein